jgi:hypothetical protein
LESEHGSEAGVLTRDGNIYCALACPYARVACSGQLNAAACSQLNDVVTE